MNLINNFIKLFKLHEIIILLLLIVLIPCLVQTTHEVNFIYILLTNNYISLIINVYYLITMYKKIQILNNISNQMITRITKNKLVLHMHIFITAVSFAFVIFLNLFLLYVYGCNNMNINLFILSMIHTVFISIMTNIIFLQFNRKTNILFIVVPILLNFIYHYTFFIN